MPDLSSITLPNNVTYTLKDSAAREDIINTEAYIPMQAEINNSGLIAYKNNNGVILFTLQLPIYNGSVT